MTLFCLIITAPTSFAADKMNFYDKKENNIETQGQNASNFSFFKDKMFETESTPTTFDLYGEEPLKAPPGGGEPIGGVTPVGDGLWVLLLLAAGYICFQYKRRAVSTTRSKS